MKYILEYEFEFLKIQVYANLLTTPLFTKLDIR